MVIEPPHPASKAKKAANVAYLRNGRARSRIVKATGKSAKVAAVDVPEFNTVYSNWWSR